MHSARLLAVILLVGCLPIFAQDQQAKVPSTSQKTSNATVASATSEPLKIAPPVQPRDFDTAQDVLQRLSKEQSSFKLDGGGTIVLADHSFGDKLQIIPLRSGDEILPGDDICYNIRSYVVARDQKDSDSTHPVKSSTCQPGRQYRLKSAIAPAADENR